MKRRLKIITALILILIDQVTKFLSVVYLKGRSPLVLLKNFICFNYSENTGACFGMLSGQSSFVCIFNIVVLSILAYILFAGKIKSKITEFGLLLILAGGMGNIIDRVFRGYVVDFIEPLFINFAIFNFADSLITIGSTLILISLFYELAQDSRKSEDAKKQADRY